MNNQQQRSQELVPCPGCKGTKMKGMALCHDCKKEFVAEAADIALAGNPVPTYEEWIERRIRARIPTLQAALKTAQENLGSTQKKAEGKLHELLTERVSGQDLDPEILAAAKAKLKEKEGDKIWKLVGGAVVYRECKISSSRLQEAHRLIKDLEIKKTPSPLLEYGEKIIKQK